MMPCQAGKRHAWPSLNCDYGQVFTRSPDGIIEQLSEEESMSDIKQATSLMAGVNLAIKETMRDAGISRAILAKRLGISRAAVTQALNDPDYNWTIKTLALYVEALDCGLHVYIKHTGQKSSATSVIPFPNCSI